MLVRGIDAEVCVANFGPRPGSSKLPFAPLARIVP